MKFPSLFRGPWSIAVLLHLTAVLSPAAPPAEPQAKAKDLPRAPAVEPNRAVETFQVKTGFRIELVAAEPLVVDPVAISFDENGRLFVVEMRDYSERRDERLGRIRLLEDTDGDGRFDKATIYADNLPWPTGVICYEGGVFVAATPDLIYLKDTKGDGVADRREVVFTGFGSGHPRLNVQQLFNSLTWSLDDRIHGANGGNDGSITSPKKPGEPPLDLRGRDFSFDPRTLDLRAESGGGQYGLSFDDRGRKFVCSNSSHLMAVMYEERYAARNPYLVMPPPAVNIAVDGPAAEIYRISPDEPWRVLRTQWRVAGLVPGPIEGGGRASGYFSAATGITVYRGDAWPEELRGDAFVADCGGNLVHHKKIVASGAGYSGQRLPDEQKVEFLASRDNWCRPVQLANAPDGNLYVVDMYREVVEHPWSLPDSIKKYLDLDSGNRGRIYRIVPEGFRQGKPVRLGSASASQLVATLESANGWQRDTAARLLYERQDSSAIPRLNSLLRSSKSPLARMHSLYALEGLRALESAQLIDALNDEAGAVRQHALRLAGRFWAGQRLPTGVTAQLARLAADSDPQVRYQLAFTLGDLPCAEKVTLLTALLHRDAADPWMRLAVLNSLPEAGGALFDQLSTDASFIASSGGDAALRELARMIGTHNERAEVDQVLAALARWKSGVGWGSAGRACSLANALGEGVQHAGSSLRQSADRAQLDQLLNAARSLVENKQAPIEPRLAAVRLLGQMPFASARAPLRSMLEPEQGPALQKAAVRALAGFVSSDVTADLLGAWEGFTPELRSDVVDAMLRRSERVSSLLDATQSGKLRPTDFSARQMDFLRNRTEPVLRDRAIRLLGEGAKGNREAVVKAFSEALLLTGNAEQGRRIYVERCSSCHRLAGQGQALGPDLESVRANGKQSLLTNLIDPNREVLPKYVNYLAETNDGETLTGLVAVESETNVTLRQPNGIEVTLLRSQMKQFRSLNQSAMPEGLEQGLGAQDLADLMEYVLTAKSTP